jgi:transposase
MQRIPKQEYTAEFKEQAVKRVTEGKGVGAVARKWVWSSRPCATG